MDNINHPSHYQTKSGLEVIDVIEAFELNFLLANSIKYILRSGKKGDRIEDLKKAVWYLQREIQKEDKKKQIFGCRGEGCLNNFERENLGDYFDYPLCESCEKNGNKLTYIEEK